MSALKTLTRCLQGREFGRQQGEQIMDVLDRWARISEADDSALDAATDETETTKCNNQ